MNKWQLKSPTLAKAAPAGREPIRLDRTPNPYGPTDSVFEALSTPESWNLSSRIRDRRLEQAIAKFVGMPPEWMLIANGIDELLDLVYLRQRDRGALVLFPPSNPDDERRARIHRLSVVPLQRTASFAVELDADTAADLPEGCMAIVSSPNDPSGTLLEAQDAVRLARSCELVVIDERHGAYSGRTLLPLAREFDNIVLLQTFETWAALDSFPVAYAIAPPKVIEQLRSFRMREEIASGAAVAALATLDDLPYVQATVQRVRQERSRLFRTLRKLNMVSPRPSWANFLPVRIERGTAALYLDGLAQRGILVHRPAQPELARVLRISAGRPEHTDALKRALIDIAAPL